MERVARVAAAGFVLVGGLIHLQLWDGGYRGIRYIGPWFVANVVVSALFVVALLASVQVTAAEVGAVVAVAVLLVAFWRPPAGMVALPVQTRSS